MQHVNTCLHKPVEDRLDGEIEMENLDVVVQLMMSPFIENPLEMGKNMKLYLHKVAISK